MFSKKNKKAAVNRRWILATLCLVMFICGISCVKNEVRAAVIPEEETELIWFGDSRTVYLGKAVYGYKPRKKMSPATILQKHMVARRCATYGWANGTGYKELSKRLKKNPDAIVIFNFGVNDIGRGHDRRGSYMRLIRKIRKNHPDARLYFMSVNPVKASSRNPYAKTRSKAKQVNRKIATFNTYIRKHLPKEYHYINTNKKIRFRYLDGLHYTYPTYRNIAFYVTGKKKLDK